MLLCILTELEYISAFQMPFSCISTECVITKRFKVSLRMAPTANDTTLLCLVPSTRVILRKWKPKPRNYCQTWLLLSKHSCRLWIWPELIIVNLYGSAIAKWLPVSNKQTSLVSMEATSFVSTKPKLSDNYFCTGITGMNYGRPIKIAFLWSRKFPLGCKGHVSKFPIQSLLSFMSIPTSFLPCNFCPALTGSTHNRPWRTPKNVDSPIWMLQYMPFEHLACTIGDFENECGKFYIKPCSLNTIYCHLFSAWIWTLDSHVYYVRFTSYESSTRFHTEGIFLWY